MSKYLDFECSIQDRAAMLAGLAALTAMFNLNPADVVVSEANDIPLFGYHGDKRKERAMFVVRRAAVGSMSNDIGFYQAEDGKIRAYISDFDHTREASLEMVRCINTEAQVHTWTEVARARGARCEVKRDERGRLLSASIRPMGGR